MKKSLCIISFLLLFTGYVQAQHEAASSVTPEQALKLMKDGHARFFEGKRTFSHLEKSRIKELAEKGQHPYAIVLSCSDSRVPPEHIFDVGLGDIFIIRVAGNTCNIDQAASIEYSVEHHNTPLVLVMGHTRCGAVKAAVEDVKLTGSEPDLIKRINQAAERVKRAEPELNGQELLDAVARENVWVAIEDIFNASPLLRKCVREGRTSVIGALYDLEAGKVTFLGSHRDEKKLLDSK